MHDFGPAGGIGIQITDLKIKAILMVSKKVSKAVTPAVVRLISLDSRIRGNDENGSSLTFYEFVKLSLPFYLCN